jgi:hypothetical protein
MTHNPLRIEYGPIEGELGFYYWYIGGPNFQHCAGDFSDAFLTLEEARQAADKVALAEGLSVYCDPTG